MDHPFRGSRGKAIQPRTQEVFEDLGIDISPQLEESFKALDTSPGANN